MEENVKCRKNYTFFSGNVLHKVYSKCLNLEAVLSEQCNIKRNVCSVCGVNRGNLPNYQMYHLNMLEIAKVAVCQDPHAAHGL